MLDIHYTLKTLKCTWKSQRGSSLYLVSHMSLLVQYSLLFQLLHGQELQDTLLWGKNLPEHGNLSHIFQWLLSIIENKELCPTIAEIMLLGASNDLCIINLVWMWTSLWNLNSGRKHNVKMLLLWRHIDHGAEWWLSFPVECMQLTLPIHLDHPPKDRKKINNIYSTSWPSKYNYW